MAKILMSELAGVLAERHHLGREQAQQFLSAFVETIREGIANDGLVKIKGLGTFKLIDVDARESVSVNTGERVVIDSHSKLTFLPDLAMKELVNKPFAQFDTVILNEGVSFDQTVADEGAEEAEPEPAVEEPAVTTEEPEPAAQVQEPEPVDPVETPEPEAPVETPEPEAPVEEPEPVAPVMETAPVPPVEETFVDSDDNSHPSRWWLWLLLAIVACAASFGAGYLLGRSSSVSATPEKSPTVEAVPVDTLDLAVPVAPADSLSSMNDTTATDSVEPAAAPAVKEEWKKYEEMDNRVRFGAYRISGTDYVIKAREGDNSRRIARRTLGNDMECYIEVYNGISGSETLKTGQEVKIPKLEWKKKKTK